MSCKETVAREGDWIELKDKQGNLVASFMVKERICRQMLDRMIVFKYNLAVEDIVVKVKHKK